jgi:rubrerythrin
MENSTVLELLELLEQQEKTMYRLYTVFAAIFPDYQTFWLHIAEEEQQHARWIKALRFKVKAGSLDARKDAIHAEAVRSSITFINKQIERAKSGNLSALNAFSIAMSIEDDILEKRFFKVFMPQETPFEEAMQKLIQATRSHREGMRRQFNEVRTKTRKERHAVEADTRR